MNYHDQGITIASDYLKLVKNLAELHFPRGNTALVALSLPSEAWFNEHRAVMQRAFPEIAWDGDGWPVSLSHRLCSEWQRWRVFARTGQGGPRNLQARQAATGWCEKNRVDREAGLDPGAPWHLPFLCSFAFVADVSETDGRGYYETLRRLFNCGLEDNVLQRLTNPTWARVWQSVAEWAREQRRGFMLAELPDHFTFVGWPLQHVLLSVPERRELEDWIDGRRDLVGFTKDDLKQWIEQQRPRSTQLELTRKSDDRLRLLHAWASGYERTVPSDVEPGAKEQPETDRVSRCALIMELDDDGSKVCVAYLGATESVALRAFGGFEFGGGEPYLREAGSRRPYDLRNSRFLLSQTCNITGENMRWPDAVAGCRYLINNNGEWIEESTGQIDRDIEKDVLVLCARGAEGNFVEGEGKPIRGLDGGYTLLRCKTSQLVGLPDPPPRVMLEGGVRLLPASRCDYFGVALPQVRNERPAAHASPVDFVMVSADGTLSASESRLDAHLPPSVSVEIEAADGAKQQIRACFPKQRPSALPSDEDFRDLAVRGFPDAHWAPRLAFGWTPRRRLLCIYSTSSSSEAVLRERIDRLFGAQPAKYLRDDLTDLGHLTFSTMHAQQQAATTVSCSDARFEVIAQVRDREQCVVARLVGAHDWVRLHGLEAEGMEWVEVEEEIFVRASLVDIRNFADDRKVSVVRCDQVGGPIEKPSVVAEVPGIPWDDGVDGVEVWNPLYPLRTRELHSASLQSLIGLDGTIVLRHQGQFVKSYLRMRWDGRCWQRAPIPGRLAADHYWISVRNGWHRYGMVMHGQAARIPLLYGESSQAMYFMRRLRPPVESRRRLCSLAGGLPTRVERGQVQVNALERLVGGGVFKDAPYFLRYGGVSKEQAGQLAAALDAELVSVE